MHYLPMKQIYLIKKVTKERMLFCEKQTQNDIIRKKTYKL